MTKRVRSWLLVAVVAAVAGGACKGGEESKNAATSESLAPQGQALANMIGSAVSEGDDGDQDQGTPGGGELDMLGSLLASRMEEPGPYDEPRSSPNFDDTAEHAAVLELEGPVAELESFSLLSGASVLELGTLVDKLRELAANDSIKGLLLRAGDMSLSMATAEELRAALVRFKGAGERKLWCHTEGVSNVTYYVLTACDAIALAPLGSIEISGVTAMPIYLKGLLGKLGIAPDFLQVGEYKGAAEPLTRDAPSPEMRKTIDALLEQAYATMVAGIAEGRKLDPKDVAARIDTAMFQGEEARAAGLVDAVAVYEAYRDQALGTLGWTKVKLSDSSAPDLGRLMQFLGIVPKPRPWQPHVALVHAVGDIIDGKGSGIIGARQEIASRTLSAAVRTLAADDNVKAIVLRIDSGGGSALASEQIWNALTEAKAKKPVVVSMAGMAASGGYYIACGATKVYALDNTLTGSIGVVGGKLALRGALAKIGVTAYPMSRGKRALLGSAIDPWTADERRAVEQMMQGVYKTFVDRVAAGRGKSWNDIDAIARGRVWTGAEAKKLGLVDEIGGLDAALAEARKLGGVAEDAPLETYPPEPTLIDILGSMGAVSASYGLRSSSSADIIDSINRIARDLGFLEAQQVAAILARLELLRDSQVLAATFVAPVIR